MTIKNSSQNIKVKILIKKYLGILLKEYIYIIPYFKKNYFSL
jgi:hypothetical protein